MRDAQGASQADQGAGRADHGDEAAQCVDRQRIEEAAGALIGGIAGGKKGAAIGALAGGGGAAVYTYGIRKRRRGARY